MHEEGDTCSLPPYNINNILNSKQEVMRKKKYTRQENPCVKAKGWPVLYRHFDYTQKNTAREI